MFLFSILSFLLLILNARILSIKSVLVINLKIITPKSTYFQTETWYFSTHHLMCNTLYHSVTTFWKPGVCIFSTKCSFGAPTGYVGMALWTMGMRRCLHCGKEYIWEIDERVECGNVFPIHGNLKLWMSWK